MSQIILTVQRIVKNENFNEEHSSMKERMYRSGRMIDEMDCLPKREYPENALVVELTEDQFTAIKKAVIEKF